MAAMIGLLPRLQASDAADPAKVKQWADNLVGSLESAFQALNAPIGQRGWQATGTTVSRVIDGDTATLVQTSTTLNTLLVDLLAGGIITLK